MLYAVQGQKSEIEERTDFEFCYGLRYTVLFAAAPPYLAWQLTAFVARRAVLPFLMETVSNLLFEKDHLCVSFFDSDSETGPVSSVASSPSEASAFRGRIVGVFRLSILQLLFSVVLGIRCPSSIPGIPPPGHPLSPLPSIPLGIGAIFSRSPVIQQY